MRSILDKVPEEVEVPASLSVSDVVLRG